MAKIEVGFDSFYSLTDYDGKAAISQFRRMPGVNDLKVYRAVEGKPSYTVIVDIDDDKIDDMKGKFQSSMAQYTGYISNVNIRVLKDLGI
jgi:hypothetical protein